MIDTTHIDLLKLIPGLTWVARTGGGEYAGPCPMCGGDDRFRVWPHADRPSWWCRRCEKHGDAITLVMERDHIGFRDALTSLGLDGSAYTPAERPERPIRPPTPTTPPGAAWQVGMTAFVDACQQRLSGPYTKPYTYLTGRGLREDTISLARLGYNHEAHYVPRDQLGLAPAIWRDDQGTERLSERLRLPRGITIPVSVAGVLWGVYIRQPMGDPKYWQVAGGKSALYGADTLRYGFPAFLTEGALDALAIQQEAGDLAAAVSSGTTGARSIHWITKLCAAEPLLLSFDQDPAGIEATRYWRDLFPASRIWRAWVDDPAALLQQGFDVRGWVEIGLGVQPAAPSDPPSVHQGQPVAPSTQGQPAGATSPDCPPPELETLASQFAAALAAGDTEYAGRMLRQIAGADDVGTTYRHCRAQLEQAEALAVTAAGASA